MCGTSDQAWRRQHCQNLSACKKTWMITTWKWTEEDKVKAIIKPVVDNYVFVLDISVENASCVQKVYCRNHLSGNGTNVYILSTMKKCWLIFGGLPEYKARQWFVHDRVSVNELEQVHVAMFFHHHLIKKVVWIDDKCSFFFFNKLCGNLNISGILEDVQNFYNA